MDTIRKQSGKTHGQTLVEVMVALFVLTVGFMGILSLLAQSIYISKNLTNETTATYLAAEGIELAKNRLDHDIYQRIAVYPLAPGWAQGWTDPTFPASGNYQLDYTTCETPEAEDQGLPCGAAPGYDGSPLLFDAASGLYGYESGTPTPFYRIIKATVSTAPPPDPSLNEITIQSIVNWEVGGATQQVELEDHFYNWHP
jgi:Tfp pilus assembly protein PilV